MKAKVNKVQIQLIDADILSLPASGLVVVTDTNLNLDPALAEKAGTEVNRARQEIGWCRVGSAVTTSAGNLAFKRLIYAVGPRWGEGSERGKLGNVVFRCLQLVEEHRLRSVAFPPVSVGIMGFPVESCARIMLGEIIDFTFEDLRHLRQVFIALPDPLTMKVFETEFSHNIRDLQASGEGSVRSYASS